MARKLPKPLGTQWETDQWGHARLEQTGQYTEEQVQEYTEGLEQEIEALRKELIAAHAEMAELRLNAEQGWQRYEISNRLVKSLSEDLASNRKMK